MKIGILQTGRSPDEMRKKHGDYGDIFQAMLAGRGFAFDVYAALDGELPASVDAADGWLITGSKFGVYEDHAWIPPLEEFLRAAFAQGVPIIGVCFGHQLLAQALGGKVEKFVGGWSVGAADYDTDDASGHDRVLAWHQDQIVELPPGAEVIGSSDFCQYAMLAYGDRALTVQPHPEFTVDFIADLIEARGAVLPDDIVENAKAGLNRDLTSYRFADRFEEFFKRSRADR